MSSNTCKLKKGRGKFDLCAQKEKLNFLLESFQNVFELRGRINTYVRARIHINTGNSPPISVPIIPFRKCGRPPRSHRLLVPRRNQRGGCNKW
ncbi:hypothetical protein TNCV_4973371 [Trichonephila clavipes]|uniref:Uncharacterized protein n=1 Tax=Trichonephila clavipes TaxID=2585209 RepID=A0A8X6SDD7_TRICX|nr:hypothetical protein TNCV_4973371 [Trichonephila clavipes]